MDIGATIGNISLNEALVTGGCSSTDSIVRTGIFRRRLPGVLQSVFDRNKNRLMRETCSGATRTSHKPEVAGISKPHEQVRRVTCRTHAGWSAAPGGGTA